MLILTQSNDSYTNKMKWDPKNLPPNKINFSNDIRYISFEYLVDFTYVQWLWYKTSFMVRTLCQRMTDENCKEDVLKWFRKEAGL